MRATPRRRQRRAWNPSSATDSIVVITGQDGPPLPLQPVIGTMASGHSGSRPIGHNPTGRMTWVIT